MLTDVVVGIASALVASWLVLTAVLLVLRPRGASIRNLAQFVPEVARLMRGLYRDPDVPRSVRWRLWVAVAYNVQPFNLIPDFVPVIGFADNAVVIIWALRSAVRKAGSQAIVRHWQGTPEQLGLLFRLAHLGTPTGGGGDVER